MSRGHQLASDQRHHVRRLAVQALYHLDASGTGATAEDVERALLLSGAAETMASEADQERLRREAIDTALAAWALRDEADRAVADLAPQWPTYRQPVVDRGILRLGYYELTTGHAPPKVIINECVELAREFSTDKSPLFINGVLDKVMRRLRGCPDPDITTDDAGEPAPPEIVLNRGEKALPGA